MQMRRLLTQVGIGAIVALSVGGSALAAEQGESITASPAQQRFSVNPGGSVNGSIKILNQGTTGYEFTLSTEDFSISSEDYDKSFKLPTNALDAARWFQVGRTTYRLDPGQNVDVPFTLRVPQNATPGGHYAAVFAATKLPEGTSSIVTQKRVGVLTYITVNGDIKNAGSIESWDAAFWQTQAPLKSAIRIKNDGNNHFDAKTRVVVTDIFGNTKSISEATNIVLPGTIRRIPVSWDGAPAFGLFKVSGTVEYLEASEALPARYVLMLGVPYFFLMLGLVSVVVVLAFRSRRKRHGRR